MVWELDRPAFTGAYKTIGFLWCPQCLSSREFILIEPEAPVEATRQAAEAECVECQYQFGMCTDEKVLNENRDGYVTERRPVLSTEVLLKARDARLKRYREEVLGDLPINNRGRKRLDVATGHGTDSG